MLSGGLHRASSPEQTERHARRTLLALLFVSGASSLIYELIWIRALGLYFGTTVAAITTVVATYTAGLAIGSVIFGRRVDRSSSPLRLYGSLELAIGLVSLVVSLFLFRGAGALSVLSRLAAAAGPLSGPLSGIVRAFTFFAILLLPTTLMGGTLPVVARASVHTGDGGKTVGILYAVNTAGAVLGALAPDGLLVPAIGMTMTALIAVLGNLVVALAARRLPELPLASRLEASATGAARKQRVALLLFSVSGFCAMGYEVLWSRVLEHLVEGLVIGFSVLLATYLVAVAIGSRLTAAAADRSRSPLAWAALYLSGSGLSAFAPVTLLPRFTSWVLARFPLDPGLARPAETRWWALSLADSLFLEGISCLLMGAAFPFLAAVCVREGIAGRGSGRLYAANSLCGVVGAFVAGFLLIPWLGVERGLALLSAIAVTTGTTVLFATERAARLLVLGAAVAISAWAFGWTAPKDQFRRNYLAGSQADYVREGTTTSVAVISHSSFGSMTWRELRTPGVSMSDTRFSSRRYMGLMAHLPMFFARGHKDALLICFGVGNTARSLLSHPDLDRLDVVDISSEVLSASPYFAAVTSGDPLLDPRTHVTVDDGRHYLLTTTRFYDVITSEPPPPNHAGVVNLYSREYYRAARRVLRAGGILAQWLPVSQLSERDILAIIGAMAAEFPYVELRYGFNYQWIILGSDFAPSRDVEKWREIAAQTSVARDLDSIGVRGEPDLAATRIQSDAMLRAASAVVAPVDDDFPSIEYPMDPVSRPPRIPAGLVGDPIQAYAGEDLFADEVNAIETMAIVLRALPLRSARSPELRELTFGTNLRAALHHAPGHPAIFALLDVDDIGRDAATAFLALHAGDDDALFVLARRAYYEDNFAGADARMASVHPAKVGAACYWLLRAGCARAMGRFDDAVSDLRRAVSTSGDTRFQAAAEHLAARARAPWRVDFGPLSVENVTEPTP